MSLTTWKEEFYKIPAEEVAKENAVEHSLQKWHGLREENLRRHGLRKSGDSAKIYEPMIFGQEGEECLIYSDNCALCHWYAKDEQDEYDTCGGCPLVKVRNGLRCDQDAPQEDENENVIRVDPSPYFTFVEESDPEPMIELLEKARE